MTTKQQGENHRWDEQVLANFSICRILMRRKQEKQQYDELWNSHPKSYSPAVHGDY